MDRIAINELLVRCVLGVDDEERRELQDVLISVTLHADLRKAGASDRLEDAIDYRSIKKEILGAAEGSRHRLVEALAERVAALCLGHAGVRRVDVVVEKPGSLRFARSAAVTITRRPARGPA
ncbi:dihydroneopterin aldolase [Anaeromyxobacter diazotrophicus]|uniref:dihydroneopterin aldolase n=1 Tax=Anaeromyxobacter diazotrophicus TaxID=2590199 RepID=A0A7I9VP52_9BACT|nr:dihydroneopterin aldolase [Anaeromyxobacter diazotrophicus]GEJ58201.1 7,8-dihydroneopterin aldolase [Anaeromyxobacter diazotrophicus]